MLGENAKSRFLWVGNWLAVDFVNTAIVLEGRPVDLLGAASDFFDWLREAGIMSASHSAAPARTATRVLKEAVAYRTLLRKGLGELVAKRELQAPLLRKTNAFMAGEANIAQLSQDGGRYKVEVVRRFEDPVSYVAPLAQSFAALLAEGDLSRLRKCKNPECVLYFYDTSKSGTRSWCSLDLCGNKMRMASSRERHRA